MHLITRFELFNTAPCQIAHGDVGLEAKVL